MESNHNALLALPGTEYRIDEQRPPHLNTNSPDVLSGLFPS